MSRATASTINEQTQLHTYSAGSDPRDIAAEEIYQKFDGGWIEIHKTTRAGATTSLILASIRRGETIVVVEPTNDIITSTILKDIDKYSQSDVNTFHVKANKMCPHNLEMIDEYPRLGDLQYLPLEQSCHKCDDYRYCGLTRIARDAGIQVIAITYDKFLALLHGHESNEFNEVVLESIYNADNILFDECHSIAYGSPVTLDINAYDSAPYMSVDNSIVNTVIAKFNTLLKCDALRNLDTGVTVFQNPLDDREENSNNMINGTTGALVDIATDWKKCDYLSVTDYKQLPNILKITMCDKITAIKDDSRGFTLRVLGEPRNDVLTAVDEHSNARKMLTSATITSVDYGIGDVHHTFFGKNGDPMGANSMMTIVADSKRYHMYKEGSMTNAKIRNQIIDDVLDVTKNFGDSNCLIIAMNKKAGRIFGKALKVAGCNAKMMYYKGEGTQGTANDKRVVITIGSAYKPLTAYSGIVQNYEEKAYEAMHEDTYQAISRAKDPNAIERSYVFMMGTPLQIVDDIMTWGIGRNVDVEKQGNGKKTSVKVSCVSAISKPRIVAKHVNSDWEFLSEVMVNASSLNTSLAKKPLIIKKCGILRGRLLTRDAVKVLKSIPTNDYISRIVVMESCGFSIHKTRKILSMLEKDGYICSITDNHNKGLKSYTLVDDS